MIEKLPGPAWTTGIYTHAVETNQKINEIIYKVTVLTDIILHHIENLERHKP